MTRKDFKMIAACFTEQARLFRAQEHARDDRIKAAERALRMVAEAIAEECYLDNPRFDRDRFMAACGLPSVSE